MVVDHQTECDPETDRGVSGSLAPRSYDVALFDFDGPDGRADDPVDLEAAERRYEKWLGRT